MKQKGAWFHISYHAPKKQKTNGLHPVHFAHLAALIVAAVLAVGIVMIVRLNTRIDGGAEHITAENFSDTPSDGVNYFTVNGRTIASTQVYCEDDTIVFAPNGCMRN